jgi:hypothetical protein
VGLSLATAGAAATFRLTCRDAFGNPPPFLSNPAVSALVQRGGARTRNVNLLGAYSGGVYSMTYTSTLATSHAISVHSPIRKFGAALNP